MSAERAPSQALQRLATLRHPLAVRKIRPEMAILKRPAKIPGMRTLLGYQMMRIEAGAARPPVPPVPPKPIKPTAPPVVPTPPVKPVKPPTVPKVTPPVAPPPPKPVVPPKPAVIPKAPAVAKPTLRAAIEAPPRPSVVTPPTVPKVTPTVQKVSPPAERAAPAPEAPKVTPPVTPAAPEPEYETKCYYDRPHPEWMIPAAGYTPIRNPIDEAACTMSGGKVVKVPKKPVVLAAAVRPAEIPIEPSNARISMSYSPRHDSVVYGGERVTVTAIATFTPGTRKVGASKTVWVTGDVLWLEGMGPFGSENASYRLTDADIRSGKAVVTRSFTASTQFPAKYDFTARLWDARSSVTIGVASAPVAIQYGTLHVTFHSAARETLDHVEVTISPEPPIKGVPPWKGNSGDNYWVDAKVPLVVVVITASKAGASATKKHFMQRDWETDSLTLKVEAAPPTITPRAVTPPTVTPPKITQSDIEAWAKGLRPDLNQYLGYPPTIPTVIPSQPTLPQPQPTIPTPSAPVITPPAVPTPAVPIALAPPKIEVPVEVIVPPAAAPPVPTPPAAAPPAAPPKVAAPPALKGPLGYWSFPFINTLLSGLRRPGA